VRLPFLIEGAFEATFAMIIALVSLHFLMNHIDVLLKDLFPLLGGGNIVRLTFSILVYLILGGFIAGLTGARLSVKKLESI
jgi:cell division protein FtsX